MIESNFEKIRNLLSPIYLILETMKYGTGIAEKGSMLETGFNCMEEIKALLDKMEREENKK